MRYYAVAEIEIENTAWIPEYVNKTTPLVEAHGGRYLARTPRVERIEGERKPPAIFLIIEWPSKEAAEAFYASADYRPLREARTAGSRGEFALVAGEDVTGRAGTKPSPPR
jgi:uncharacterized protein (DUF1330 family)